MQGHGMPCPLRITIIIKQKKNYSRGLIFPLKNSTGKGICIYRYKELK
jgi:hypothetical protein